MTTATMGISGSAGYCYRLKYLDEYIDGWVYQPAALHSNSQAPTVTVTIEDTVFTYLLAVTWIEKDLTYSRAFVVPLPNVDHLRQFMRYLAHELSAGRLFPYPILGEECEQWRRVIRNEADRVVMAHPGRVTELYDHPTGKHEDDN